MTAAWYPLHPAGASADDLPAGVAAGFRSAIDAAVEFIGATAPNPPVGCAILDASGTVLMTAAHQRAGQPHAEALALRRLDEAGLSWRAATLLVTLEPCNHRGRTGPCTEAILASPVRSVWIGSIDPNPHVSGHGAERLRAAGCTVQRLAGRTGAGAAALARECDALIVPFRRWADTGRPWVSVKQALDAADGMIPPPGAKTFTTPASLRLAHRLRRCTDAIVTGTGTLRADRPGFTVRHLPDHPDRRRLLAVLGRAEHLPDGYARLAAENGLDLRMVASPDRLLPLLAEAGVLWAMVEAGPRVLRSLRDAGLWDDWLTITHPDAATGPEPADRLGIVLARQAGTLSPLRLLPELRDIATQTEEGPCSRGS